MTVAEIEETVVGFVTAELGVPRARLDASTPLFSGGLLDSFALVTLLAFVEERWGVALIDADLAVATLDSVSTLAAHVYAVRSASTLT